MLEVKVQDSPTVDLGKYSPQFEEQIISNFSPSSFSVICLSIYSIGNTLSGSSFASVQVDLKNGEVLLASDVRFVLGKISADNYIYISCPIKLFNLSTIFFGLERNPLHFGGFFPSSI